MHVCCVVCFACASDCFSRYATREQMAKWNNMSLPELTESMKGVKGLLRSVMRASEMPEVTPCKVPWSEPHPLFNQVVHVWKFEMDGEWHTLPSSFDLGLKREVTFWVNSRNKWEEKRLLAEGRGKKLSKHQQKLYDTFYMNNQKKLLINSKTGMPVACAEKITADYARDNCMSCELKFQEP